MEFPFQINSLEILPNDTLFMWPENNAPEGATSWRERDGRARWHISFWGKLTSQFCPVIDSIWLRSFSLACDCHLDSWEAKACNYSQATLLSEPGGLCLSFYPGWSQVRLAREGARREGKVGSFSMGKAPAGNLNHGEKVRGLRESSWVFMIWTWRGQSFLFVANSFLWGQDLPGDSQWSPGAVMIDR